ncbi:ISAs1 family transposase, partial [Aeromonas veronii]|uniref:ISAs1 family transposase n=1 Tax=Aeromonas veronii TaxID=654 RepID=UPI001FD4A63F
PRNPSRSKKRLLKTALRDNYLEKRRGVRSHWGIENQLHWVLDVTMKEDNCPIYRGDAAEILATARHMALNMLRAEEEKRASIRRKQKIAAMNSDYLEQVIVAGIRAANKN